MSCIRGATRRDIPSKLGCRSIVDLAFRIQRIAIHDVADEPIRARFGRRHSTCSLGENAPAPAFA